MFLTARTGLYFIILTAISLFFLSSVQAASVDISIDAPSEVTINESFDVTIDAAIDNSTEVKIFINRSSDAKSMSEILVDGEWKKQYASSPYYFSYPDASQFSLRAFDIDADTTLCVYLKTSPLSKACVPITILEAPPQENQEENTSTNEDNTTETEDTETNAVDNSSDNEGSSSSDTKDTTPAKSSAKKTVTTSATAEPDDAIYLNSPDKATELTNYGSTRLYVSYGFAVLAIILLILVALDKI